MRILAKLSPAFLLLALMLLPAEAYADSVVINNGYLSATGFSGPTFSFGNPAQGFSVSNVGFNGDGGSLVRCSPCASGQLISTSARFVGEFGLGHGPATFGGINYSRVYYTGTVDLTGPPVIIPSGTTPFVSVSSPFVLSGVINAYATPDRNSPPIFSMTLEGQGIATMVLSNFFTDTHGWLNFFQSMNYNFSPTTPTPEPATILLLGTGLAAAAARYRRRTRQTKP